jgi:two-component sensor histidine kinase
MTTSTLSISSEGLLLRELTHRINNEFASVIQTVSFKVARSSDRNVKEALASVMEQLHDYAKVHHALQMPASNNRVDAPAYLRSLCDSISRSKLKNRNIELVLADVPFQMSSERCWMMGMIVAELITNAMRHAFDEQGGTIEVECKLSGAFVECWVSDNGSASSVEVRHGSGLKIIEALAQELGASFHFKFGEDGSKAVLIIPVEPTAARNERHSIARRQSMSVGATRRPAAAASIFRWIQRIALLVRHIVALANKARRDYPILTACKTRTSHFKAKD